MSILRKILEVLASLTLYMLAAVHLYHKVNSKFKQ